MGGGAIEDILSFTGPLHIADVGAAYLDGAPVYQPLMDRGLARLSAFDGDPRQVRQLAQVYGARARLFTEIIADGKTHTLHVLAPETGMSSTLKPSPAGLAFFNGFSAWGAVQETRAVQSRRLDDIAELPPIDFLHMDIQGAELMALEGGQEKLASCVAIQTEVSFIPLYENQPTFGEIDGWMRAHGFAPHCFTDIKRWSIAPTVRNGDVTAPFNQLLEGDMVYIPDPLKLDRLADEGLKKLCVVAAYVYGSLDLAVRCVVELEARRAAPSGSARAAMAVFART